MTTTSETRNLGMGSWLVRCPGSRIKRAGKVSQGKKRRWSQVGQCAGSHRVTELNTPGEVLQSHEYRRCLCVFPLQDGRSVCIPCILPHQLKWWLQEHQSPELQGQPANMSWDRKAEISEALKVACSQCPQNASTELQLKSEYWVKKAFQSLSSPGLPSPKHSMHCSQNNLSYFFVH